MRVIFIIDTFGSGGAQRVMSVLANYFAAKYPTEIVCIKPSEDFYKTDKQIKITHLFGSLPKKLLVIRRYLKGDDIVVPFMENVYGQVLVALFGKKANIVASERNDPRYMDFRYAVVRRLFMHKIRKFVVQTNMIKEYYPKFFQKKIYVIPNPVERTQYTTNEWNPDSKIILAVARTEPQKNYPMMIRAFSDLHIIHPEYRLEIYGCKDKDAEYAKKLLRLIDKLDAAEYIHINGRTQNVAELYSKAYMFVMSSDYEGLSNSLIEAMCSGLPVVSTKVSGATDLINDGVNGLLVDVGNQKSFTDAMQRLIEDKLLASTFAKNAIKCRELLDKERICSEWEKVVMSVSN